MNPLYILLIVPGILAWWAQAKVRHVYEEYGRGQNTLGVTGFEVARQLLAHHGLTDVTIDRTEQVRTPITDGAANEPWLFRYKDIRQWWSRPHHNRPGGIRDGDRGRRGEREPGNPRVHRRRR